MARPKPEDYPPFYETYVSLVKEEDVHQAISSSLVELKSNLSEITNEKGTYAYAPGKWTVKQLLQHAIDAERIFQYRALCIARGEQQSLPGFDENSYAANADASDRHLKDLKEEMMNLRQSGLMMFQSFTPFMLQQKGTANNSPITALSLGYILIGHWRHHWGILKSRYGI
ncbi:DinB family protein [Pollutibacter soli]|uniref:DinB family protein n=1 Tax=Pollutibacter soli TaxID=3034157 RepID=UPI003013A4BF